MQSVILELKVLQTCQYRIRGLTCHETFYVYSSIRQVMTYYVRSNCKVVEVIPIMACQMSDFCFLLCNSINCVNKLASHLFSLGVEGRKSTKETETA